MPRMEDGVNPIQPKNAEKSSDRRRQNLIFAVLSLLVCALMPICAIIGSQQTFGRVSDFPEYYSAMKMICQSNGAEIYKLDKLFAVQHECFPDMQGRGIGFYIPPFSAVLLAPLGLLPASSSYCLYMIASVAALLGGIVMLGRHFGLRGEAVLWLAAAVCATSPAFESLKIAQLAPFLFASLAGFLLLAGRGRDIAAGACLALLLLKPQELAPIVVYSLCACRFRIILSLAAVFMLLMAASWLFIGPAGFGNYFDLLKDSAVNSQFMQPELSATFRGQLLRVNELSAGVANLLSSSLLAALMGLLAWAGFKFGRRSDSFDTGLLRLALPLGIVSALHCHDYDLLLLAPFVLRCFLDWNAMSRGDDNSVEPGRHGLRNDSKQLMNMLIYSLALFLLCLTLPIYVPIHYQWLMKEKQVLNPLFVLLAASSFLSAAQFLRNQCRSVGRSTTQGPPPPSPDSTYT